MNWDDTMRLIVKARAGLATQEEVDFLTAELVIYRGMAVRLEGALHEIIKETEKYQ